MIYSTNMSPSSRTVIVDLRALCASDDWRSALRLSWVSRHFRNVVLNTPQAWCSIFITRHTEITDLYLKRSGQCKLHIGRTSQISFPEEVMHRIKCITISYLKGSEVIVPFLSLERLRIHDIDQLFEITSISFPALRHLDISGVQSPIGAEPSFLPPLESLGIRAGPNEQTWLAMMQGCSASLRSLYIVIDTNRLGTTSTHINLPRLHHLRLGYTSLRPSMTMLHLNVPRLRVYINPYSNPYYSILAHGLQTVTHLRIYEKPSLPMLSLIHI